jgi:ABC-type Mn2+/Zn2+ transport system ATPase subunit
MGPNGAGKSTFLKLVTEKLVPTEGKVIVNPDYKLAYFGQHSTKELKMNMSPIEFMVSSYPEANRGRLLTHLARTSIGDSVANTAIKNLSYSQRSCVIFAKLTFYPPHLLIMDEPTNFLDLDSVDSLIRAANNFSGGLITVTHNRDFLRRCSKTFLSIVPGQFQELPDMKAAERATYSFISAMEEGRAVDAKSAIIENRGGGAAHTDEEQAARQKALRAQQRALKKKRDAELAEKKAAEDAAAAKEAARKAKVAAQRTDWKADEVVWVNHGGKWQEATVTRNVPGVGVTVQLSTGACKMLDAKKLKAENPQGSKGGAAPAGAGASAQPRTAGGRGQSSAGGRGQSSAGGRGQSSAGGRGNNNKSQGGAAKGGNQSRNNNAQGNKGKGQQQAKNTGSQGASRNTQQRQNSNSAPIR